LFNHVHFKLDETWVFGTLKTSKFENCPQGPFVAGVCGTFLFSGIKIFLEKSWSSMIQTWHLSKPHHALFTDNPHIKVTQVRTSIRVSSKWW